MVAHVEKVLHFGMLLEHDSVHGAGDLGAIVLDHRGRGLQDGNGLLV